MMGNKIEFIFGHMRLLIISNPGFVLHCFLLPFLLLHMYHGRGRVAVESENKKLALLEGVGIYLGTQVNTGKRSSLSTNPYSLLGSMATSHP